MKVWALSKFKSKVNSMSHYKESITLQYVMILDRNEKLKSINY